VVLGTLGAVGLLKDENEELFRDCGIADKILQEDVENERIAVIGALVNLDPARA
jgi:hypothetical protein